MIGRKNKRLGSTISLSHALEYVFLNTEKLKTPYILYHGKSNKIVLFSHYNQIKGIM